jgi:hypothetical protein
MSNIPTKQKTPAEARAFFSAFGVETTSLSDEQVKANFLAVVENLSPTSSDTPSSENTTLDLAYKISTDYIASSTQRFDKMDEKLQTVFTFAVSVFAIAPALFKPDTQVKTTTEFWFGMGLLMVAGLISVSARLYGKLNILNPKKIHDNALHLKPEDFKKLVIETSGDAYVNNQKVIENKHQLNVLSMFVFGGALICLIYWLVKHGL